MTARNRYSAEQIIGKLREAEMLFAKGQTVGRVSRALGITEQNYYNWRKEHGGLKVTQPGGSRRPRSIPREEGFG